MDSNRQVRIPRLRLARFRRTLSPRIVVLEQPQISQFISAAFRAWQQAGIRFLILRNYDGLPDYTSNDIDVLLEPRQAPQAEQVLIEAACQSGFRLHCRGEFATLALYFSNPSGLQAHFDLFTALKWRGFDFLDCQAFLDRRVGRGLFAIPHPADEAATNLLASFLFNGKVKEKYRASIQKGFRDHPQLASALLAQSYGPAQASFLVAAGSQGRWTEIEAQVGTLRRALVMRHVTRRLWSTLHSQSQDLGRFIRRAFRPPGMALVLCGADGCGKSTAARAVIDRLSPTFSPLKGRQFHWKPPVFSGRRRAARAPISDPHGQAARSIPVSMVYFAMHWIEFFLGSFLVILPVMFRGGLVLIDRYYYDFIVDPKRYRLRLSPSVARLGYRLLPKPDLVILLDAPTAVLRQRKQEVPPEETERQRQAYRELVTRLGHGLVVDAAQPAEVVAEQIHRAVLQFMVKRTEQRLGRSHEVASNPGVEQEARG